MRTRFVAHCVVAGLLAPLAGCGLFINPQYESQQTTTVPHVSGKAVDVETENGTVSIVKAERDDVLIEAEIRAESQERADTVNVVADRGEDGTLTIRVDWPGGERRDNEGCDFNVEIPDARGVTIRSSNGRLTTAGLGGTADLASSNGSIEITGHDGPILAESSNGGITITDATGEVNATTSNGRINVSLTPDARGPVVLGSSNGGVELFLGSGFRGEMSLSTSNGSVDVSGLSDAKFRPNTSEQGVLVFGDGPKSSITTSNGSIHVHQLGSAD